MAVTRGVRNNNPGNIERGASWMGLADEADMTPEQRREKRFAVFTAPRWGIRAICKLLLTYQSKYRLHTVKAIISRWAPPRENVTSAYVQAVAAIVGVRPDDAIDVRDYDTMRRMVEGIIAHENAGFAYPPDIIDDALRLAGIEEK